MITFKRIFDTTEDQKKFIKMVCKKERQKRADLLISAEYFIGDRFDQEGIVKIYDGNITEEYLDSNKNLNYWRYFRIKILMDYMHL